MLRMFGKIAKFFKKSAPKQSETPFSGDSAGKPESKALGRPKFAVPGIDMPVSAMGGESDSIGEFDSIAVPFTSILQLIPKELHGKMAAGASRSLTYNLPKVVALEQLPRGCVKVAFGDLRRAAPAGLFVISPNHDSRMVDLPLREILSRLNPEAFARRPAQNRITVPDDVTDIFGAKGERLTDIRLVSKSEAKVTPQQPGATAPPTSAAPAAAPEAPPTPIRFSPNMAPSVAKPAAPAAQAPVTGPKAPVKPPTPTIKPTAPAPAPRPAAPTATPIPAPASLPSMGAVPKVPVAPAAAKPAAPVPSAPPPPAPPLPPNAIKFPTPPAPPAPTQRVAPPPVPAAPVLPAPAPVAPVPTGEALSVSIAAISQKWPQTIRILIQQLGATEVEIPTEFIAAGLKSGKVEFQWEQIAAWLRPAPQGDVALDQANTVLEVPLNVIAPLFLQQSKYRAKQSAVPAGIPDLFSAKGEKLPQGEVEEEVEEEEEEEETAHIPAVPAPRAPIPTAAAAPVVPAAPATPHVPALMPERQRAANLAQLFGEPNKKNWTPNEIVHKTITMPGVMGALIALQDGLLVAGCMPPPWKTETIAAFIPQIFGRLTQYTKELQMGEVNTVSFGVESGTLQIFNAGIIYFGALGKHGTLMPVEDLTLIATELSRHTK
jgi:predicted regulator of Ras-like GTPase activity (Roadblock/LC7/MglB family)